MGDILLLLGTALFVLSVIAAIVSVINTRAPRGAAILFCAGLAVLAVCAWLYPGSVGIPQLGAAWGRLFG
ncbi:hypothetical protein FQV27_10665 [Paracoccus aurantiacus]|uniref:Uncharacterized protein n=1 Tax=Paracoccus aurantiacus TaxID=2599412 RepID=A0A5C6S2I3_9RHOB|nr:hypothetical protein [Paracoccus aurantiacus]TXB68456.1 hypothetical protein FQV27_10665 [Paracoccus aurantiacus]